MTYNYYSLSAPTTQCGGRRGYCDHFVTMCA